MLFVVIAPNQPAWQEVANPEPAPGEVLVRVLACGVCGTDLRAKAQGSEQGRSRALTLGHEIVGQVEAITRPAHRQPAPDWEIGPALVGGPRRD